MRTPTASELLSIWESACERRPTERALALLALALPELGEDGLAECSIGTRDDYLLGLREMLFGAELAGVAQCPACSVTIETCWHAQDLRASIALNGQNGAPSAPLCIDAGPLRIRYRLPNSHDMLAIAGMADPDAARGLLLSRCVLEAPLDVARLPADALAALEDAMAANDPMADIECALACPDCGHGWSVGFDIGRYLWAEIHAWAQRLLVDVHTLARAYGWREADILAMSPGRRGLYVEMSAS